MEVWQRPRTLERLLLVDPGCSTANSQQNVMAQVQLRELCQSWCPILVPEE